MSKTTPQTATPRSAITESPVAEQRNRWIITVSLQSVLILLILVVMLMIPSEPVATGEPAAPAEQDLATGVKGIQDRLSKFTPADGEFVVFEKKMDDTMSLIDKIQKELKEIVVKFRDSMPNGKDGPKSPEYEAKLLALDKQITSLTGADSKIEALPKAMNDLLKQMSAEIGKIVSTNLTTNSDNVAAILTRELKEVAASTQAMTKLQNEVTSLTNELRHEEYTQDIAIVAYHAVSIDASPLIPAIEDVILKRGPRTRFSKFRVGVHLATNGEVSKTLLGLTDKAVRLPTVQIADGGNVEQPPLFDPATVFAAGGKYEPWQRRLVFVVSSNAEVPTRLPPWEGVAVDVILWDDANKMDIKRFREWAEFCRTHQGMVIPLTRPAIKPEFIWETGENGIAMVAGSVILRRRLPVTMDPFKMTLQRLVNPF